MADYKAYETRYFSVSTVGFNPGQPLMDTVGTPPSQLLSREWAFTVHTQPPLSPNQEAMPRMSTLGHGMHTRLSSLSTPHRYIMRLLSTHHVYNPPIATVVLLLPSNQPVFSFPRPLSPSLVFSLNVCCCLLSVPSLAMGQSHRRRKPVLVARGLPSLRRNSVLHDYRRARQGRQLWSL